MIKVENIEVWGWESAIRGMRNPMNSWEKSDTLYCDRVDCDPDRTCPYYGENGCNGSDGGIVLGKNDLDLMRRLFKAGTEHRKYLRMIHVTMDIIAPLYWWKEFDTYKIGTVANSCSTMHKLTAKPFEASDFSFEHVPEEAQNEILDALNDGRSAYINFDQLKAAGAMRDGYTKKDVWYCLIQFLPSSYNQRRTVDFDYETAFSMIRQRTGHKLDEWNAFVEILKDLPYVKDIGDLNEESNHVQRIQSCSTDAIEHV